MRIGTFACVCTVHVQRLGIMSVLLAWSLWSEGWVVGALRSKVVALIVWHGMVCGGVDGRLEVLYSTYVITENVHVEVEAVGDASKVMI